MNTIMLYVATYTQDPHVGTVSSGDEAPVLRVDCAAAAVAVVVVDANDDGAGLLRLGYIAECMVLTPTISSFKAFRLRNALK